MGAFFRRLLVLIHWNRLERDLEDELSFHLAMRGAHRTTLRSRLNRPFGSTLRIKEECRDAWLFRWLDRNVRDATLALRQMRRAPAFAFAAVLTLGVGMAMTTAVFSVVDAVLLRPLPYPNAERIVGIGGPHPQAFIIFGPSPDHFRAAVPELTSHPAIDTISVHQAGGLTLDGERPIRIRATAVSPSFFGVLGVLPLLGQTFRQSDADASRQLVVLSHRLWRQQYGADPEIVGKSIGLNGRPFRIMSVMPPSFNYPVGSDLWIPQGGEWVAESTYLAPVILAKLRAGVSQQQGHQVIRQTVAESYEGYRGATIRLTAFRDVLVGSVRPIVITAAAGAFLLLLVSCVNVAHLLLGRLAARQREFAVRRALGASPSQLVGQVLWEGLSLSIAATAVGLLAATWITAMLRRLAPDTLHGASELVIDARVLAATALLAIATTLMFASAPALSVRLRRASDALRSGHLTTAGWRRFRRALVVSEVAAAVLLLSGALTAIRSVGALTSTDIGIGNEDALTFGFMASRNDYRQLATFQNLLERIETGLRSLPGVESVGLTDQLPAASDDVLHTIPLVPETQPYPSDQNDRHVVHVSATSDYFRAAGIRILAGRSFTDEDTSGALPVIIVSESVARALNVAPPDLLGERIVVPGRTQRNTWAEIVGVARDVKLRGPERSIQGVIYRPLAQNPWLEQEQWVVVKSAIEPHRLANSIQAAMSRADSKIPLYAVRTFQQVRRDSLASRRFTMTTMTVYGVAAFGLAALGLYGVIAYVVQLRRREYGIQLALGASPAGIRRDVIASGLGLATGGITVGIVVAFGVSRLIWASVPGFDPLDLSTVGLVSGLITLMALMASWAPAHRATRVDPAVALRCE